MFGDTQGEALLTPKFITFEGGDGVGKSTQTSHLASFLEQKGISVLTTREPGGPAEAEKIRKLLVAGEVGLWDPKTEVHLHYAARIQHIANFIMPSLKSGKWVICDRFSDSTIAYQGFGHQLDITALKQIEAFSIEYFKPDFTILLDLPVSTSLARTRGRQKDEDRYERMGADFHERVRNGFLEIEKLNKDRIVIIDAGQSEIDISKQVIGKVCEKFQLDPLE